MKHKIFCEHSQRKAQLYQTKNCRDSH